MKVALKGVNLEQPVQLGQSVPAQNELEAYAKKLLGDANGLGKPLANNQKLIIEALSEYIPLAYAIVEAAYKDFKSGRVQVKLIEPEIEELKQRFSATQEFTYKQKLYNSMRRSGAATIKLEKGDNCYNDAKLNDRERQDLIKTISPSFDGFALNELKGFLNPKEIIGTCLNLQKGQALHIKAHREHMPNVIEIVEEALNSGASCIDLDIIENPRYDFSTPLIKYASNDVLKENPEWISDALQELTEKNCASLLFEDRDVISDDSLKEKEKKRKSILDEKRYQAMKDHFKLYCDTTPVCSYYYPTTVSAKASGYRSLGEALRDAKEINRTGSIKDHAEKLQDRSNKLNALIKQGYRILRFKNNNNGTDFSVKLTPNSVFITSSCKTPNGQSYIPNVPCEECFTAPDSRTITGKVITTRPTMFNGRSFENLSFEFLGGKLVDVKDSRGVAAQDFMNFLKLYDGLDYMGEIALVAGSPIFNSGKVFNITLVDENAASHFALGYCFERCISMDDKDENQYANLKKLGVNCQANAHVDFTFGDENLEVCFEKDCSNNPESICLIRNNKFQELSP